MIVLMALVNLDDADAFLRDFATRYGIRRLALFCSVLRGEDTPASDVDLLVEFEEGRTPGLLGMAELELELGAGPLAGGRAADLRKPQQVLPRRRPGTGSCALCRLTTRSGFAISSRRRARRCPNSHDLRESHPEVPWSAAHGCGTDLFTITSTSTWTYSEAR